MLAATTGPLELAVAQFDFKPVKPTDLGFQRGDVLQLLEHNKSKNWWKAQRVVDRKTASTVEPDTVGDIPKTYVRVFDSSAIVVAFHPWTAQDDTEISFTTGTVILVYEKHETGWWKGRTVGNPKQGIFPGTFVRDYAVQRPSAPPAPKSPKVTETEKTASKEATSNVGGDVKAPVIQLGASESAAIHGTGSATFALDDFDAFDILMARGWCFNPDYAHHKPEGNEGAKPVPGQSVTVHLALFRWDGNTGNLTRLASSCAPGGSTGPVTFRIAEGSWLDADWMTDPCLDETATSAGEGWAGGVKQIAAVHLAVQELSVGGMGELVASPEKAYGENETMVGDTNVVRNSQVVVRVCLLGVGDKRTAEPKTVQEEDWDPDLNPKPVQRKLGGGERAGRVLLQVDGDDDGGVADGDGTIDELAQRYQEMHGAPGSQEEAHVQARTAESMPEEQDDELAAWDRQMREEAAAKPSSEGTEGEQQPPAVPPKKSKSGKPPPPSTPKEHSPKVPPRKSSRSNVVGAAGADSASLAAQAAAQAKNNQGRK